MSNVFIAVTIPLSHLFHQNSFILPLVSLMVRFICIFFNLLHQLGLYLSKIIISSNRECIDEKLANHRHQSRELQVLKDYKGHTFFYYNIKLKC